MGDFRRVRPTRAEVDLAALEHNVAAIRDMAPRSGVLAVIKANAYGHGAVPIARTLQRLGIEQLAVALVEEALELRAAGIRTPLLILGGCYDDAYDVVIQHQLTPAIFRVDQVEGLGAAARRLGTTAKAHLKIDTGMGRIGARPHELPVLIDALSKWPEIVVEGILSHFANADLADHGVTQEQLQRYLQALELVRSRGLPVVQAHLSNSAGVLALPAARDGVLLNLVRPGLMLYGVSPSPALPGGSVLRPVLSWKTAISHLKEVPAGTPISYGGTWVAARISRIATLPVGYADGFDRAYSNRGKVLVRGQRAPIVGRVCMDMVMVDVTDIPGVALDDEVVLLGRQGTEVIHADELAALSGTISYEILCGIGARVPREYIPGPSDAVSP